jgi:Tudor domain
LKETIEGRRLLVKHREVFKRGKIVDDEGEAKFKVYLIDYGEIINDVDRDDLYTCEGLDEESRLNSLQLFFELPPQCIECRLSELIPSPIRCASGWSDKSTEVFKSFIDGKGLEIVVNSFVDRIASVRLIAGPVTQGSCESVNEYLVLMDFAQTSDDSYMNQLDSFEREKQSSRNNRNVELVEDEFCDVGIIAPPQESLYDTIDIEGPFTPLESRAEMINREKFLDVVVEPSSVNHVLIDPYPNDSTRKLLVSASMSEKDKRVTLHQTTIMPHLPGMLTLLGLLFSPAAEVHMTPKKDRYTSILCGLGADESRKPHFGEHDLLIKVDVELTHRDFEMINELRDKMSTMLNNAPGFKFQPKVHADNKATLRNQICQKLITLTSKHRSPLGVVIPSTIDWNWKPFVKSEDTVEVMYPQLAPVDKLMPMSENTRQGKIKHAVDLERLGRVNAQDEVIECQLCEERIETLVDLQLHVGKKLHKERLVRMRDETSDAY